MKRFKLLTFFTVFISGFVAINIFATANAALATICNDPNIKSGSGVGNSSYCQGQSSSDPILGSGGVLTKVTDLLSVVGGFIAVVIIIVSGIEMVMSGGNSEKVANSRNTIIYAAVGIVIIALARVIVIFIVSKAG
ncbi:MAG TPA: hypothetical protein VMR76_03145 [Candidatus Saccharimonadia bacterium]|nr:hypothetical protein [Candidatus Saccharimonadia bacterium]